MQVICLDLEGVLVPEVWLRLAEETGIDALRATTRDISDYDALMQQRLGLLREHGLNLQSILAVIDRMQPLPGAKAFLDELREHFQVIILSDTFYEFAQPLMAKLAWPTLLCHRLDISPEGHLANYLLRQTDAKRKSVMALQQLNYRVLAAGDSYNDTTMLAAADAGFLFRAPENVVTEFPQFPVTSDYETLHDWFLEAAENSKHDIFR